MEKKTSQLYQFFRDYMKENNKSFSQMADELDPKMTEAGLRNLINNSQTTSLDKLFQLAKACDGTIKLCIAKDNDVSVNKSDDNISNNSQVIDDISNNHLRIMEIIKECDNIDRAIIKQKS